MEETKWEYLIRDYDGNMLLQKIEEELDYLGKNGWELISVLLIGTSLVHYYKRVLKSLK